ncbi:MAG: membrane dipeptidase [Myxococcota bacterium]|nr:membrane dipeptidase [Myxococcota bacterium]
MRCCLTLCALIFCLPALRCGENSSDAAKLDLIGGSEKKTPGPQKPIRSPSGASSAEGGFVVDLIQDLVFRRERDRWTLQTPHAHVTVEKLRLGGVDLVFSALPMTLGMSPEVALERALRVNHRLIDETQGAMEMVTSLTAARAARKRNVIPVMLLLEGADALTDRLERIPDLKRQGLTVIGLVAGHSNGFADVAVAPRENGGLTSKGRALLQVCRDTSIAVDVTHASKRAFWDILIEQSGAIIASHTAARALRDHPRNLDDLQILALSRYGGVMGLVFNPEFLRHSEPSGGSTLQDVVAHIMHVKAIGAVDALALGTDYGGIHPPLGLEDISKLPMLKNALVHQGLSDVEISGIFGKNAADLFSEIERDYGALKITREDILRPIEAECDAITGEYEGLSTGACNGFIIDSGPTLVPTSRIRLRIKDMTLSPVQLEIFGEPSTPWQIEGQNLSGRILFTRVVALDNSGRGLLPLPANRNLTRLFCSPTRTSSLKEAVVWGK